MKRSSVVVLILLIAVLTFTSMPLQAQKQRSDSSCEFSRLQCSGAQLDAGKFGFYVPTDEEGCDRVAPQGCKMFAVINSIPTVFNEETGRFETVRDDGGHILVNISIKRSLAKGGDFQKDNVPFTDSGNGTFRVVESGDTRGLF